MNSSLISNLNGQNEGNLIAIASLGVNGTTTKPEYKYLLNGKAFPAAQHNEVAVVENFKVEYSSEAGAMVLKVKNPGYANHGTDFAFWKTELGPAPANIKDWFHIHSNGHSTTIYGLKPGVVYPFAASYRGLDKKVPMWSDVIRKSVGE